jgi:hypothetical protein
MVNDVQFKFVTCLGMKDCGGVERGRCERASCDCEEFFVELGVQVCGYCSHFAGEHCKLTKVNFK